MHMNNSIRKAAQDALGCQDACNASGVAHSMLDAMAALRTEKHMTTGWVNTHPIVFMFLYKLMALNGHEPLNLGEQYSKAESMCREIAGDESVCAN